MEFVKKIMVEYVVTAFMITLSLHLLKFNPSNTTEFVYGLIGAVIIMFTIPVSVSISKWALK